MVWATAVGWVSSTVGVGLPIIVCPQLLRAKKIEFPFLACVHAFTPRILVVAVCPYLFELIAIVLVFSKAASCRASF